MSIFADTLYWVAITIPGDPWHDASVEAQAALGDAQIFTTEEVLTEFLTALASGGPHVRRRAAAIVREILRNPMVTVAGQSHETFLSGLTLYENRPDKGYSLVDCISMCAMRSEEITDILTNDHHFTQEGFNVLIAK